MVADPPFRRRRGGGMPPRRRIMLALVGLFLLFFAILPWLAGIFADWLWFRELGYQVVFTRELTTRSLLFAIVGVIVYAFIRTNVALAQRPPVIQPVMLAMQPGGAPLDLVRISDRALRVLAIVFAFLFAVAASATWLTVLRAMNRTTVGVADPIFGRDIGYYFFTWPLLQAILGMISGLILITILLLIALYWVRGELVLPPRRVSVERTAAIHIGSLLAAYFVLLAARLIISDLPSLLFSQAGPLVGAGYADVHARIPGYWISAVAALIGAALIAYGIIRGKLVWHTALSVVVYVAAAVLARGVYPFAVQRLVVAPNELARETPYLRNHIAASRRAWGLDKVETRDLTGEADLSLADIRANGATIENVRLWERHLLQQTFGQLQEIRTYYDFVEVDDDRYVIDGRYRQVHLSARELNSEALPTRTFINERLTFTHGMGLTLAPVNQVTSEGLPVLFVKDLPPVSTVSIKPTRPAVYYGELTNEWVAVHTRQREFDYPAGDQNIFTSYEGRGGVQVSSVFRRALFAFYFGSLKLFLSNDVTSNSRMMYVRNISARAKKALPFLDFDADPYLVLRDDGTLAWILDAYTRTDRYPYSLRLADGTGYMRNSVKVVIDAYHGTVDSYIADPNDALVRAYGGVFPGIFKPLSAMPVDLQRHIRYPTDLFRVQNLVYSTFHMIDPHTFYHREDQWQIPSVSERETENPFMRHIIMRLPGEREPEFLYMTPFNPRGKQNLAAWLVARNDGANYGKLVVYRFPKQSLVYGPRQIVNRINQDTEIARQITLWDQRGSEVIRGELLVIPIEESLMYVQPLYLRAEGGTIPELKRVVVAHQNQVVMEETLEQALAVMFGGAARSPVSEELPVSAAAPAPGAPAAPARPAPAPPSGDVAELLRQARQHYDRAIAAQRTGDWARYGEEIRALGRVLDALRAR